MKFAWAIKNLIPQIPKPITLLVLQKRRSRTGSKVLLRNFYKSTKLEWITFSLHWDGINFMRESSKEQINYLPTLITPPPPPSLSLNSSSTVDFAIYISSVMICFPGDVTRLVCFVPLNKPLNKSCSQDVVALKTNIARTLLTGEISFVEEVYLGCLDDCRFGRLRVEAFFF